MIRKKVMDFDYLRLKLVMNYRRLKLDGFGMIAQFRNARSANSIIIIIIIIYISIDQKQHMQDVSFRSGIPR